MARKKQINTDEAKQLGASLGFDWTKIDLAQFRRGLEVELEHGARDPQTDVTGDDMVVTGKIAWAHLKEFPDYYTRLDRLETEAVEYWTTRATLTNSPMEKTTMTTNIQLSNNELAQLHLLLTQELESSRVELHHTAGLPYRDFIKQRMDQEEALLKKLDAFLPTASGTETPA